MPSLRDLEVVRRLNAPTRAAATRRRRLRKAATALLLACAALVGFGGHSPDAATADPAGRTEGRHDSQLQGRQLVAVPVDAALVPRLGQARVDVWAKNGTRLAEAAPTTADPSAARDGGLTGASSAGARALVALTPASVSSIAAHLNRTGETWSDLFLTLAP